MSRFHLLWAPGRKGLSKVLTDKEPPPSPWTPENSLKPEASSRTNCWRSKQCLRQGLVLRCSFTAQEEEDSLWRGCYSSNANLRGIPVSDYTASARQSLLQAICGSSASTELIKCGYILWAILAPNDYFAKWKPVVQNVAARECGIGEAIGLLKGMHRAARS